MIVRALEVRDIATCIPVLAIKMESDNEEQRYLLARCGFLSSGLVVMKINDQRATSDPYEWNCPRTMRNAHLWIQEHFDELRDGDVVDVEFILGEKAQPAVSERVCR